MIYLSLIYNINKINRAMNPQNFTEKSSEIVANALQSAQSRGHSQLVPAHLALALFEDESGLAKNFLTRAGGNPQVIVQELQRILQKQPSQSPPPASVPPSQSFMQILQEAEKLQKNQGDSHIAVDHLIVACASNKEILSAFGVSRSALEEAVTSIRGKRRKIDSRTAENTYDALKKYATDLTEMAEKGKLDPVIGRDEEIRRVIGVLARRRKNNPCLIGEPGVGKTAIVEGLAQRILKGDVPESLQCRLYSLDLGALIASGRVRGTPQGSPKRN